jgi:glucokinase
MHARGTHSPVHLHKDTLRRLFIGLDVGGTKIAGIVVDQNLYVRSRIQVPMNAASADDTLASIITSIHRLLEAAGSGPEEILAIGLGIPGKVQAGTVSFAVNLRLESCPLSEILEGVFHAPVILENDVRAAAVGVYQRCQEKKRVKNLTYLSVGTGISAGVILNGQLYRGSNGMAGEVGHIVVDPEGRLCNCGLVGCLETVAAGPAIVRQAVEALQTDTDSLLRSYPTLTAENVFQAAQAGDRTAGRILQRMGSYLARAIYALLMSYDVDLVVLGGGVASAGEAFLIPIQKELSRLSQPSNLAQSMLSGDKIRLGSRDDNPGAWGMVTLAKQMLQSIPAWSGGEG